MSSRPELVAETFHGFDELVTVEGVLNPSTQSRTNARDLAWFSPKRGIAKRDFLQGSASCDSKAVKGVHRVRIGVYWIELMIGDLVRSTKEIPKQRRNSALLEELDAVCSALEYALTHGHRNVRLR